MKINFKKRHLNINLFYGILFGFIGLLALNINEYKWFTFFSILLPVLFLMKYFFLKHNKYLTIDKGVLKVNDLFGKQIYLSEINGIDKYAGKYIMKTDKKKLSIDTNIIEPNSLTELNMELGKLNIEWN
jgi:hypothetical protein